MSEHSQKIKTIALLGGECSGKSTLAEILSKRLNTIWVQEFARDYWFTQSGIFTYEDMPYIAQSQIESEINALPFASNFLICDTTPLTTLFYCLDSFKQAPELMYTYSHRPYDFTFLLDPNIPCVQDGARCSAEFRQYQFEWFEQTLQNQNIAFTLLQGDVDTRVAQVLATIDLITP